ncbi:hypothetical protein [Prescottella equi]|uniref:hypothetical protein n=1 Tax=Rhodococcus hoagii TaxID=43767 RepID=UPI003B7DD3FA
MSTNDARMSSRSPAQSSPQMCSTSLPADVLDVVDVEAPGEQRQPAPQLLFLGGAQVVAPPDAPLQRLLSGRHTSTAPRQQAATLDQALQDLLG